nr:pectinesterase 1-like [Ipomoea batatas]
MEDSFSKTSKEAILQNQSSSSGNRTKLQLTFYLLIFFSLIIASIICVFNVLNYHAYSQMLIHNPKNATHVVCIFTSDPDFCYDAVYVSSPPPDGTNPTHIFYISLLSSLGYLSDLVELPKSTISGLDSETRFVLRKCELAFVFAQSKLNESVARLHMEKSEYGKLLGVDKLVWDLQSLISQANGQVSKLSHIYC